MADRMHDEILAEEPAKEEREITEVSLPKETEIPFDQNLDQSSPKQAPNKLKSIKSSIDEWLDLQREIKTYPQKLERYQQLIEEKLNDYRLAITGINYKALNIDIKVWDQFQLIISSTEGFCTKITQSSLWLRTLPQLREIKGDFENIRDEQQGLVNYLPKAIESLQFFDKMERIRNEKRDREQRREGDIRKIEQARQSLVSSLNNVRRLYDEEPVKYASNLVSLEESQRSWEEQIDEIIREEQSDEMNVDEILDKINAIQEIVIDSPNLVLRIREVETRLNRITQIHNLLIENGKSIVPQKDMVRISGKLYDQVPKLWATGQKDDLEKALVTLEDFLSSFENSVETELAYLERRKPGVTRSITPFQQEKENTGLLSQLIVLSKSMVNALDARDHLMRGHSDSVARMSVMVARQFNWDQSDLDLLLIAGILHDIGKISIPETILSKTAPLTPEEWKIIQMHPYFGAQIIKPIVTLARIVPWVYHHH
jgi:HD-GYP domain-containing protein (c-di-GMP phosphodiesterase class II)